MPDRYGRARGKKTVAIRWPARKRRKQKKGPLRARSLARKPRAAPFPDAGSRPEALLALVLARLDDDKAAETVTIDLKGKSTLADYMVVTSGRSQRHVGAIAEHLIEALHLRGAPGVRVEGLRQSDWVLIDAGDVIVHVFRPEVRTFYDLEKMWARARPSIKS
jgi:ribosome-associated protein